MRNKTRRGSFKYLFLRRLSMDLPLRNYMGRGPHIINVNFSVVVERCGSNCFSNLLVPVEVRRHCHSGFVLTGEGGPTVTVQFRTYCLFFYVDPPFHQFRFPSSPSLLSSSFSSLWIHHQYQHNPSSLFYVCQHKSPSSLLCTRGPSDVSDHQFVFLRPKSFSPQV